MDESRLEQRFWIHLQDFLFFDKIYKWIFKNKSIK